MVVVNGGGEMDDKLGSGEMSVVMSGGTGVSGIRGLRRGGGGMCDKE